MLVTARDCSSAELLLLDLLVFLPDAGELLSEEARDGIDDGASEPVFGVPWADCGVAAPVLAGSTAGVVGELSGMATEGEVGAAGELGVLAEGAAVVELPGGVGFPEDLSASVPKWPGR